MATSIIKPVHAGIDFSFTIAVADWSSSSPYTYTWTNSAVTDGCRVEVDFSSASTNTDTMYLSYEKVSGGIQFTAPAKPTTAITVVVHVINAQTGNTLAVTDEMVSSDAISGAANVNEALTTLNSNIAGLFHRINVSNYNVTGSANTLIYTGVSITIPQNSFFTLIGTIIFASNSTQQIVLSTSSTNASAGIGNNAIQIISGTNLLTCTGFTGSTGLTLYLFGKWSGAGPNWAYLKGFYCSNPT